jgi:diguanylate cyclase (GGDEF)-like protein
MVPGAALLAERFLHRGGSSLSQAVEELQEGMLLLDGVLRILEASHAAIRLLQPLGALVPGLGVNFARALKLAVAEGRAQADSNHVQAWLGGLWGGDAGEIVIEVKGGTLLRLSGRALASGEVVVTVGDVTAARRREQWLEIERQRLIAACDGLRLRAAALQSDRQNAEARAAAAEARAAELERLAFTDPLTGLLNRRRLIELAERELARSRRYGRALSLLMLDIDRFKLVNDRLGHEAGDAALCQVARTCSAMLRAGDLLARWGGEEFVTVLPETDAAGARRLAERLRAAVDGQPARQGSRAIPMTVSIGIAELAGEDDGIATLVARADEALYAAKRAGRNLVLAA